MHNRQRALIWSAAVAAMSFVVGLILVLNDSAAGWIFFIIGLSYLDLDASWSVMGCIQSQPHTVGLHWSYIVSHHPRRRCWRSLPVEVAAWSVGHVSRARG
jgi:hypothetical protein